MITSRLRDFAFGVYHNVPYEVGESVFEDDWDVLVLLDACRPDALREVRESYDWLGRIDTRTSVASNSRDWMERTLGEGDPGVVSRTGYVTGNPYSADYAPGETLGYLDEVWRYGWDDEVGTTPARPVTDRAISAIRSNGLDRYVVHYMQPHFPSVPSPLGYGKSADEWGQSRFGVWDDLEDGELQRSEVWDAYVDNVKYVLEEVELLLNNVTAGRVVVSADHGEAFGEWGVYGHGHEPAPVLRRVPWVETSATDRNTHDPAEYDRAPSSVTVNERLEALGYR